MNLTQNQLKKIIYFSKEQVKKNDSWHQWPHIKQTVKLAKILAEKEKADLKICEVSALLHDICKYKEENGKDHGKEGAKLAKSYLCSLGLYEEDILSICYAIEQHNKGKIKQTIEAKILYDADKLQAIGVYGLLRDYGWFISKGYSPESAYNNAISAEIFYRKKVYTNTAKKIAKTALKDIQKFQRDYQKIVHADI
ncbi:MAG: HD domain-containing protein [Candidatus Nanoarchaeia archaeon]